MYGVTVYETIALLPADDGGRNDTIVDGVASIAANLGLLVIYEGLEATDQIPALRARAKGAVQGYAVAETAYQNAAAYARDETDEFVKPTLIGDFAGIQDGDLLVVDRSLEARPGLIVVAVLDGAFTLKRLARHRGRLRLEAANSAYPPLELHRCGDVQIWGVAVHVIHPLARHG